MIRSARHAAARVSKCAGLTQRVPHKEQSPMGQNRTLDPAIARIVEALADLTVDRDIARLRGATLPPRSNAARTTG